MKSKATATDGVEATNKTFLDQLVSIGGGVEAVIAQWSPIVGTGIGLIKFIVGLVNANRAESGQEPIPLPEDSVLIQMVRDRSARIQATGEAWLALGAPPPSPTVGD